MNDLCDYIQKVPERWLNYNPTKRIYSQNYATILNYAGSMGFDLCKLYKRRSVMGFVLVNRRGKEIVYEVSRMKKDLSLVVLKSHAIGYMDKTIYIWNK